ncbi:MAG: hypothetical protein MZU91_11440 [Desulfosudis oleivorans]|nr:hypothetical protein [Desulfosudis oleivorans]
MAQVSSMCCHQIAPARGGRSSGTGGRVAPKRHGAEDETRFVHPAPGELVAGAGDGDAAVARDPSRRPSRRPRLPTGLADATLVDEQQPRRERIVVVRAEDREPVVQERQRRTRPRRPWPGQAQDEDYREPAHFCGHRSHLPIVLSTSEGL